ncbi:histone methyltransferase set2 [Pleurotus ostreatus]|uniref:Histone-lysine N-methyltransferase, H3 lysine-36 specific n=1 Tax=Pleurotus ostreatus TaxID=5322 RepID=A0A8H6ZIT2_PLEOS|nr:histone methyltransferase set2 [Pleurotus ostreatus]KAF7420904.1 histone methyltransferase set2 [Pleurotus ostreatus]
MARSTRQSKARKLSRSPTPDPGPESEGESDEEGVTMKPMPIPPSRAAMKDEAGHLGVATKDEDVVMNTESSGTDNKHAESVKSASEGLKTELKQDVEQPGLGALNWSRSDVLRPSSRSTLDVGGREELRPSPSDLSQTTPPTPPAPSMSASVSNSPFESETPSASTPLTDTPQTSEPINRPSTSKSKKSSKRSEAQLIGDLPVARGAALETFVEILDNHYQYGTLGRSREALEGMTCDCSYAHEVDDPSTACGHGSDCINRLTQVECLEDDCRCGSYCQNQRFQRKEYASIEIVQTEKKGFGLRAEEDIPKDGFIYEYVGDVVNSPSFKKRMRDYASEGLKHFYFMMLQKDEFIDATKRGGIGRFANHSCSPNCYVAKWTVGSYVRMGIFASRDIKQHEELTFNYNVDRYGHEAQTCYCGEPNCVGYIGGKTQTDIATMDDLYLDALGITDEADLMELKGTRKKKGKKIDDPDFMPTLHPLVKKDVPKVIQAIRQTQSRKVLLKLLTRLKITDDPRPLNQIMRLRGFTVMKNIMDDYAKDPEMITLSLECMYLWPLLAQNKARDSKVLDLLKNMVNKEEEESIKELAEKLVKKWEELPVGYRIPKRGREDNEEEPAPVVSLAVDEVYQKKTFTSVYHPTTRPRLLPAKTPSVPNQPYKLRIPLPVPEAWPPNFPPQGPSRFSESAAKAKMVIEAANRERERAEELAAMRATEQAAKEEFKKYLKAKSKERREKRKLMAGRKPLSAEEKEALKEKRMMKLVGPVVVKCMSSHAKSMDHDTFKKYAKELTQIIVEKEKKTSSYKEGRLDSLSEEKVAKMKKFSKEYIVKVLHKLRKARRESSSTTGIPSSSSTTLDTPTEHDDTPNVEMKFEDIVPMGSDPESDDDTDDEAMGAPDEPPVPLLEDEPMDIDAIRQSYEDVEDATQLSADPRRRLPDARSIDDPPSQPPDQILVED